MENKNNINKPQQNNNKGNQPSNNNNNKKKKQHYGDQKAKTYDGRMFEKFTNKTQEKMGGKPQPAQTPISKEIGELNVIMSRLNSFIEPKLSLKRRVEASVMCPGKFDVKEHDFKRVDQSARFDATLTSCKDREDIEIWISTQVKLAEEFFKQKEWPKAAEETKENKL
jgi:hypothetical protein